MVGILIFTNNEVLRHKLQDGKESEGCYCYWSLSKFPVKPVDRIYFAIKGQVKGYFIIHQIDYLRNELHFYSESWTPIKDGEVLKPSQGWRYYQS